MMALKIGITGGIGSGKTTVCKLFDALGVPIYISDDRAKILMRTNAQLIAGIQSLFGEAAYLPDGSLHTAHLAAQAFSYPDLLAQLNALVHPAVYHDAEQWATQHAHAPYLVRESALVYELGLEKTLDAVIVVYAPETLRIQRAMLRNQQTEAAVRKRMNAQLPDEEKLRRADFVIYNDGSQPLIPQVWALHQHFLHQHLILSP